MKRMLSVLIFTLLVFPFGVNAQKDKDANANARKAGRYLKDDNFYMAVSLSIEALRGNPKKKQAKNSVEILSEAILKYRETSDQQASVLTNRSEDYTGHITVLDRKAIATLYRQRIDIQNALKKLDKDILVDCKIDVNGFRDFNPSLKIAQEKYKEAENIYVKEEYDLGLALMAEDSKYGAYQAYEHFHNVQIYNSTYEDVQSLLRTSFDRAKYKIAVVGFENVSGKPIYDSYEESLYSSIKNSLNRAMEKPEYDNDLDPKRFVEFTYYQRNYSLAAKTSNVDEIEAVASQLDVDVVIFGMYYHPFFNIEERKPVSENVSREIKVGTKKETNKDGETVDVDVMKTVNGKLTKYERVYTAFTEGDIYIYDVVRGRYALSSFRTKGSIQFDQKWAFLSGDQQSLSDKDRGRNNVEIEVPERDTANNVIPTTIVYLGNSIASFIIESLGKLFVSDQN